ncbi:MAG: ABC transporter permease [Synergistaceae bacterium]|nr:ABC transporter permease [Synergistaceae bacterium]
MKKFEKLWGYVNKCLSGAAFCLYRMLAVFIFLLAWELISRLGLVNPVFLPPFSKVIRSLYRLAVTGELAKHFIISAQRSLTGFCLGMLFGIPSGLVIGWFRRFEYFIDPLIQVFRNLSVLALLPVFMLLFGIGEFSKIALIFWGSLWTLLLNTIAGVKSIDPQLVKAARAMATPGVMLFAKVILPGAMPSIVTGIRVSATSSVLVLIAAEMLGANKGLGFAIHYFEGQIRVPEMYSMIVVMAVLGLLISYSLIALEKHLFQWREKVGVDG